MDHQILWIKQADGRRPHERIARIGGKNAGGGQWLMTQQAAIHGIETGKWSFCVHIKRRPVPVTVAVGDAGDKYLKTRADAEQPDSLLSLATRT